MNDNIPAGHDENGVRNGTGKWDIDMNDDTLVCEFCGSANLSYKPFNGGVLNYCADCGRPTNGVNRKGLKSKED